MSIPTEQTRFAPQLTEAAWSSAYRADRRARIVKTSLLFLTPILVGVLSGELIVRLRETAAPDFLDTKAAIRGIMAGLGTILGSFLGFGPPNTPKPDRPVSIARRYGSTYEGYLKWYKEHVIDVRLEDERRRTLEAEIEAAKTGPVPERESGSEQFFKIVEEMLAVLGTEYDRLEQLRTSNPAAWRREVSKDPIFTKIMTDQQKREHTILKAEEELDRLRQGVDKAMGSHASKVSKLVAFYKEDEELRQTVADPEQYRVMHAELRRMWFEGEE